MFNFKMPTLAEGEFGENKESHDAIEVQILNSVNYSIQPDSLSRKEFYYIL
ncbi:MAG: hypothetical protein CM1200mP28_09290 [Deltaproteobacteria bacterium]|nr:MAG: hypothetical protein CM1200mP28_09290 [Deltaproteobacteria bacterium]